MLESLRLMRRSWASGSRSRRWSIPGDNDDESQLRGIAGSSASELGPELPWHVTRFHPDFQMDGIGPTPVATLARARQIGLDAGLRYVYEGNVPGTAVRTRPVPAAAASWLAATASASRATASPTAPVPNVAEPVAGLAGVWPGPGQKPVAGDPTAVGDRRWRRKLVIRRMFETDIPAPSDIIRPQHWNQTEDDWRRFLALEPAGCFVATIDGAVVATTTTEMFDR